ncbi:MAG: hypothetical protein GY757_27280 [bacterium]|nr:hypothetical protein [bacterium]
MKVDDTTLQNILKVYGKEIRQDKSKVKAPKPQNEEISTHNDIKKDSFSQDLDMVNYDKDGKVKLNSKQKEALVDFFE